MEGKTYVKMALYALIAFLTTYLSGAPSDREMTPHERQHLILSGVLAAAVAIRAYVDQSPSRELADPKQLKAVEKVTTGGALIAIAGMMVGCAGSDYVVRPKLIYRGEGVEASVEYDGKAIRPVLTVDRERITKLRKESGLAK